MSSKKSAFSLLEVAITLIIIGVVAGGLVSANNIITKARNVTAQNLTNSSPLHNISGVEVWLEGSLDKSFTTITAPSWNNNVANKPNKVDAVFVAPVSDPSAIPVYDDINRVNAVRFENVSAVAQKGSFTIDGSSLNNTDYSFVIVETRSGSQANNYFIGANNSAGTINRSLNLGYSSDGQLIHSQGGANSYGAAIAGYDNFDGPKVIIFTHSAASGNKIYINGVLAAEDPTATAHLNNITTLLVGQNYSGEIGEIAIVTKELRESEITAIENYLGEKWRVTLHQNDADCFTGTITSEGCDHTTCPVSLTGSTAVSVAKGSGSLTCDVAGYNSSTSINYDCTGGTFTPVGSCDCASGYSAVGGVCEAQCNISGVTGINNGVIDYAGTTTAKNCNAPNFNTSDSINYTCIGSTFIKTSGDCDSCNTGYALSGSSCAAITCTITGVSGFNDKTGLAYAASATAISTPCQAGYSGSPTYTCTATGAANVTGTCTATTCTITGVSGFNDKTGLAYAASATAISTPCQVGYSGSPTYTCTATGAANVTGTCAATTCSITGVSGFNGKTGLAYATSATAISSPCQSGYLASSSPVPSYTCATSGAATISGTCTAITCAAVAGTGYNAQSSLAYAASGSGSFSCNATGYSGTKNYTCTTSGAATSITGTCTPITCTAAAGTGYNAQSNLPYAASGSGSFTCNAATYFGTKNYTCTTSGEAVITGGTCVQQGWTLMATGTVRGKTNVAAAAYSSNSAMTCNSSNNGKYVYADQSRQSAISGFQLTTTNTSEWIDTFYYWMSCYCLGSGCTPTGCYSGGYDLSGGFKVYKCNY
jgi:hypothetical protein